MDFVTCVAIYHKNCYVYVWCLSILYSKAFQRLNRNLKYMFIGALANSSGSSSALTSPTRKNIQQTKSESDHFVPEL